MNKKEIVELFDRFLNENGQFLAFKEWCESQGYTLTEIGMKDE